MKHRKHAVELIIKIVMEHLEKGISVSQLSMQYKIHTYLIIQNMRVQFYG